MSEVTVRAKMVAKHTAMAFGVKDPPIYRHHDDDGKSSLHVIEAADCPQDGVTSYATVGLSDHPLIRNGEVFNVRVELLGACGSNYAGFENVLATLGFCVVNSTWFCAPGVIFPGAVDMYHLSSTMSDVYFTHPFLWNDAFESTSFEETTTAWLLAVPVSKQETEYARQYGPARLEELFTEKHIDIYDLNRASVV